MASNHDDNGGESFLPLTPVTKEGEAAPPPSEVTFDSVLKVLGEFGRYQRLQYFLYSVPFVFTSMQLVGWVFVGAKLPHRSGLQ